MKVSFRSVFPVLFLLVLFVAGCVDNSGEVTEKTDSGKQIASGASSTVSEASTISSTGKSQEESIEDGKIGTTYLIKYMGAKYEVTLTELTFAESESEFFDKYYLMAHFEIKNIGDKTEYFMPDIYFVDETQEKYDRTVPIGLGDTYSKTLDFVKKLPPGTKMSGWVAIEVPKDITSGDLYFDYTNDIWDKKPKYIKYHVEGK
ncbi:MAG: DUF4352 domain-containing protein [Candidatus Diapherotrites archaeon]|nr:DUF4352 domain-containing protein [Candidatus Diapherotrites archaeon]